MLASGLYFQTISLAYDIPAGVVNVRDWGVLPGAANAAANDAAFAAGLVALSGTGNVVFFPAGRYYFSAPVAVSGASGLTLLGDNGCSVLTVTDGTAANILSVTGGSDVTVTGLGFADGAGVAVAANGTSGLTVTNNVFTNVVGTVSGVDGTYPVSAADCPNVYVKSNVVKGSAAYTKLAYISGTTTKRDGSEPDTGELEFFVDDGKTEYFSEVFARLGLAEYPADTTLVKTGLGRFYGTNDVAIRDRISQIVVREGTYIGTHTNAWGRWDASTKYATVKVEDGATALVHAVAPWDATYAQKVSFEVGGPGAASSGGYSLAFRGTSWRQTSDCRYILRNDTIFGNVGSEGQTGMFTHSITEQNGHTLVLRGNGIGNEFRFREYHTFRSPGPIYVTNATVSASYASNIGWSCPNGKPPLLSFGSGSRFIPDTQAFCDVFDLYEFADGTTFACKSNNTLRVANLKGPPTVNANVTLSITSNYTARASDLLAGKNITAKKTLTFGEQSVADVEGVETLPFSNAGYVLATSAMTITGKPRKSANLAMAGWTVSVSDGGKTLKLIPSGGTTIFFR